MAKRKLYPIEKDVLNIEIETLKERKDWLVETFVREITIIDKDLEKVRSMLDKGEVEEQEF